MPTPTPLNPFTSALSEVGETELDPEAFGAALAALIAMRRRIAIETINGSPGSGLMRHLEASARAKGVKFLLKHKMTRIIRENPTGRESPAGRVLGITASFEGKDVHIQGRRGVIIATGGHTANVEFRRMLDPRLTEEYQTAGEPWTKQMAEGELEEVGQVVLVPPGSGGEPGPVAPGLQPLPVQVVWEVDLEYVFGCDNLVLRVRHGEYGVNEGGLARVRLSCDDDVGRPFK
jgi:hypothetical protein